MKELTAASARDLQPAIGPDGKPRPSKLKDHVVKGLELHCYPNGRKSWLLYYRAPDGTERRPKIGQYPTWRLDQAREHANGWLRERDRGNDPSAARQAYRASPTVAEWADYWLAEECTRNDKPRTLEEKQRRVRLHIKPRLGALKVADVKLKDINDALAYVAKHSGTTAARHVRSDLSGLLRFAEHDDHKIRPRHSNPVRDSDTFKKPRRRRHMKGDEAPAVAEALDALAKTYPHRVAALWCILLAGTRVTELVTARRSWRDGNTIILGKHKTDRTGDDRVIVLPEQAVKIIETLADDGSGYIFGRELSNAAKRKDGKVNDRARWLIRTVWEKARDAAGCPDLRVQDFRRTFASAAKSAGRSIETVGELLGHKDIKTTDGYSWLFNEAATAAAQDTADEIEKRMRGNGARVSLRASRPTVSG